MPIRELLLPEFDRELSKTRTMLERVPEGQPDFKPHEKSMPMARLAGHLAQLPSFGTTILTTPELDFATAGMRPLVMESRQQLLSAFDENVRAAREKLASVSDEELQQPWKLSFEGKVFAQGTRYQMVRGMFLNHIIHHRAQLGVYLRLNGVPVPSTYGPSADEM